MAVIDVLLNDCLAVFEIVILPLFLFDIGASQESVRILLILTVVSSLDGSHLLDVFSFDMQTSDGYLEQLVFPLCVECLLVEELLFLLLDVVLLNPFFLLLFQLLELLLVGELVLPHLLDRDLVLLNPKLLVVVV